MADVKNKRVNIYIDQSSAEQALEKLQSKADGFNKKIDECRNKQNQLLETIKKSEAAAGNIDVLKNSYNAVGKEIDATTKKLSQNKEQTDIVKKSIETLSTTYEASANKQKNLQDQIASAKGEGKSTGTLERQLQAVNRELDRTSQKLGQEAQEIFKLDQVTAQLNKELETNKQKQKAIREELKFANNASSTIKNAEREYKKLDQTIKDTNESLKKNALAQKPIQQQIDNNLRPSIEQLRNQVSKLRNELVKMSEDTPGYAAKFDSFRNASASLTELENKLKGVEEKQKGMFDDVKSIAFGVVIGNTVQSALESLGGYLSGIVSGNAKLSDSLADIEKSTGLSSAAVANLNKELGGIDTRTATSELREIAIGLGQLGEEANKANVEAIDKIVVALGDEFAGGAREITTELSVLRNNLQDIKTGNYATDVSRIGNALNVLGAEGLATAPVVTNIANRIAGIGQTFKLTSGQILGVAATFQELGIAEERGSTAIQKLFQKIGSEPEKFAKLTKLTAKEFKELVNRDMLGAFQLVAEGARAAGKDNIIFSKILKELDADGSGAGEVLSKLGKNVDLLTDKVDTSTKALRQTNSITDEFNKKNSTLAAELEKVGKQFNGLIQSKTLVDAFKAIVSGAGSFIAALRAIPRFLSENKTAITFLVAGLVLLNFSYLKSAVSITRLTAAKYIDIAVTKLQIFFDEAGRRAKVAYYIVVDLLTGKVKLAVAVQELWVYVMRQSLGPIGLLITLIGAGIAAYALFANRTKTLTAAQERANLEMEKGRKINESWTEVQEEANKAIASTITRMEKYVKAAEDTTKTEEERKKAIQSIININPEYFKGLDLEAVKTGVLRQKVNEYTEALKASAQQKAIFDKRVTLEQQKLDLEQKIAPVEKLKDKTGKEIDFGPKKIQDGIQLETAGDKLLAKQKKDVQRQIDIVDAQINFLDKKTEELKKKTDKIPGLKEEDPDVANPFGDTKSGDEKAAERKAQQEDNKRDALLKKLKDFQFELSQVGKQADESEINRITKKYDELIHEATNYGISYIEIEKEKNRAIAFLLEDEKKKRDAVVKANETKANEALYKGFIQDAAEAGEDLKDLERKRYAAGIINKQQLEENVRQIDLETYNFQITLATSMLNVSKQAADDLVKFKKKKNKEEIEDAVKTREQKEANQRREDLAASKVAILTSRVGSTGRLNAEKRDLVLKRRQEIEALEKEAATKNEIDITNEKARINEEYRQAELQLTIDFFAAQVIVALEYIQQGLDVISKFSDAKNAREKAALDKELKQNEIRKNSIRKLEEQRVISSQEARRRLREIEIEEEKKKEELEKKQNARNKRMAIAQASINGAIAITKILAETPKFDFGIATAIQIGLAIATTAAQIATISAQKFAGGGKAQRLGNGLINVPSNIPTQPNGDDVLATVKVGEVILNEEQQRLLGGASTFRSIGVPGFAGGGRISMKPFWQTRPYRHLNYGEVSRRAQVLRGYADGGKVQTASQVENITANNALAESQQALKENRDVMTSLMETNVLLANTLAKIQAEGIEASVSHHKLKRAQEWEDRKNAESRFK